MKYELLGNLTHFLGVENDGNNVQALSELIYWNKEQLMSGDFRILAPGLIDVFYSILSFLQIITYNSFILHRCLAL